MPAVSSSASFPGFLLAGLQRRLALSHGNKLLSARTGSTSAAKMRKLAEVEEAKELMTEALEWSLFTWLWRRARVREAADRANAALDELEKRVKARWPEDWKAANKEMQTRARGSARARRLLSDAPDAATRASPIQLFLEKVKRADERARRARTDAEKTFDNAERLLDTTTAKEGCGKAIRSWELCEEAIRLAETGIPSKAAK